EAVIAGSSSSQTECGTRSVADRRILRAREATGAGVRDLAAAGRADDKIGRTLASTGGDVLEARPPDVGPSDHLHRIATAPRAVLQGQLSNEWHRIDLLHEVEVRTGDEICVIPRIRGLRRSPTIGGSHECHRSRVLSEDLVRAGIAKR